jgi:hypothetical protein
MKALPGMNQNLSDTTLWTEQHPLSLELHDGAGIALYGSGGYPYASWPFFLWIDKTFGYGTVGRMWSESRRIIGTGGIEAVPECLARLVKRPVVDLFGDWLAATLVYSYFNDPRGDPKFLDLVKRIKTQTGSSWWSAFDTATVRGSKLTVTSKFPLQPFGFHALKLDRYGGKRLRLDTAIDAPSWRMVIISGGKQQILAAGVTSAPLVSTGGIVGVTSTTRTFQTPKSFSANAYSIALS